MSTFDPQRPVVRSRPAQQGSVAVEFALVVLMFLSLVFGSIELSRWLYGINAAQEAAREGARTAVVCNLGSGAPALSMAPGLAWLSQGTANVSYSPSGCCASQVVCPANACTGVTVTLTGYKVPSISWIFPDMTVPDVTTFLTRESMDSTNNPRCAS
jgi:Flp pilus assembly protein TadG